VLASILEASMIGEVDIAYIAGLFDGEGSINIRRAMEKKKKHKGKPGYRMSNSMRISMEITMTDKSVLVWVHEVLGVGTLRPKTVKGLTQRWYTLSATIQMALHI
jgi:hypothetical protein